MFEEIRGQDQITDHLEKEVIGDTISHAYLFEGIDGIGKKKTALTFAKAVLCLDEEKKPCGKCRICTQIDHKNHPDIEIISPKEGESTIKISRIRELISKLSIKPYSGNFRVIIIDAADRMTPEAQNSLLKSLEEPLAYNLFFLLTASPKNILRTIHSRCQSYLFHPLKESVVEEILKEKTKAQEEALKMAVSMSGGSVGMALYLFENKEIQEKREQVLQDLYSILKGDEIKIFSLAEALGKNKEISQENLIFFIEWFYAMDLKLKGLSLPGSKKETSVHQAYFKVLNDEKNQAILKILFEMIETLHYNVNLRLQWENTLIKLQKGQKAWENQL